MQVCRTSRTFTESELNNVDINRPINLLQRWAVAFLIVALLLGLLLGPLSYYMSFWVFLIVVTFSGIALGGAFIFISEHYISKFEMIVRQYTRRELVEEQSDPYMDPYGRWRGERERWQ